MNQIYGERFFIFNLSIARLSGNADIIPITVSERLITDEMLQEGKKILVKGQFRSYNSYENERNKLILTVFAKDVIEVEENEEDRTFVRFVEISLLAVFVIFTAVLFVGVLTANKKRHKKKRKRKKK